MYTGSYYPSTLSYFIFVTSVAEEGHATKNIQCVACVPQSPRNPFLFHFYPTSPQDYFAANPLSMTVNLSRRRKRRKCNPRTYLVRLVGTLFSEVVSYKYACVPTVKQIDDSIYSTGALI